MKKIVAASLFATLFTSQVGYYFIYTVKQYWIKEEMEKELLAHIPDSSLEVIIAENYGDRIEWREKNKEFSLEGTMYDVARIKKIEGKTFMYCINDKKEKQLLDELVNAVNKTHDGKKEKNNTKPLLTDLVVVTLVESEKIFSDSSSYGTLSVSPISSFKEIESPPPKA